MPIKKGINPNWSLRKRTSRGLVGDPVARAKLAELGPRLNVFIGGYFTDRIKQGDRLDPESGKVVNVPTNSD